MGKSYFEQFNDIKKDLHSVKHKLEKELVNKANNDMNKFHKNLITLFYKSYKPNTYKRKYDLFDTINKTYIRKNSVTFIMNGNNMYDHGNSKNKVSGDFIFNYIWNEGIRGLPYIGSKPLKKDYTFHGNNFNAGDLWKNPYWSGEQDPWNNIFMPNIKYGKYFLHGTPDDIYEGFIENWAEIQGENASNDIIKNFYGR